MSQQRDITAHLDDPVALERLYREDAEAGVAFVPRPCVVDASPSKPRLPTITRNTCREAGPPPDALSRH